MLKDNELIGAIVIYRQEVRPFTDKQIELVGISPPRPSSPSRTRGCSRSCANRWSSRPRPRRCWRSFQARRASCSRCSRRCSNSDATVRGRRRRRAASGGPKVHSCCGTQQDCPPADFGRDRLRARHCATGDGRNETDVSRTGFCVIHRTNPGSRVGKARARKRRAFAHLGSDAEGRRGHCGVRIPALRDAPVHRSRSSW